MTSFFLVKALQSRINDLTSQTKNLNIGETNSILNILSKQFVVYISFAICQKKPKQTKKKTEGEEG
jgi:hypothetical protein